MYDGFFYPILIKIFAVIPSWKWFCNGPTRRFLKCFFPLLVDYYLLDGLYIPIQVFYLFLELIYLNSDSFIEFLIGRKTVFQFSYTFLKSFLHKSWWFLQLHDLLLYLSDLFLCLQIGNSLDCRWLDLLAWYHFSSFSRIVMNKFGGYHRL